MSDQNETIAFIRQLVKAKRALKRLTLRQAARLIGISPATVYRFELGKNPSAVDFLKLIDWLKP